MRGTSSRPLPVRLRQAADRFSRWRNAHELGTRIPERLWRLAVDLAATYGVSRTAVALSLDYYSLKRHVEEKSSPESLAASHHGTATFLELPPSPLITSGECVIDFESARGAKMRVHLKGLTTPDLVALSRSFWSAE